LRRSEMTLPIIEHLIFFFLGFLSGWMYKIAFDRYQIKEDLNVEGRKE